MSALFAAVLALMIVGGIIATVLDNWREANPIYPKRPVSAKRLRRMHLVDSDEAARFDDWNV